MALVRLVGCAAVVLAAAGCQISHYVVAEERTPLYATAEGDEVLAELPLLHHEPLGGERVRGARLRVPYKGKQGYVAPEQVRVFRYTAPALDGGAAQREAVQRELREVQLTTVGQDWPSEVADAVREERVVRGMTRRQVEVAWGWPLTVKPGVEPGEEVWTYEVMVRRVVRRGLVDGWHERGSGSLPTPYPAVWNSQWAAQGWAGVRVIAVERRMVTIGEAGVVTDVRVEREPPSSS